MGQWAIEKRVVRSKKVRNENIVEAEKYSIAFLLLKLETLSRVLVMFGRSSMMCRA